jgi:hypothetical protein
MNLGIVRENLNTDRPILMDACPMLGVLSLNCIFAADRVRSRSRPTISPPREAGQFERAPCGRGAQS